MRVQMWMHHCSIHQRNDVFCFILMKKCLQAEFEDALLEDIVFHSHSLRKEQKFWNRSLAREQKLLEIQHKGMHKNTHLS